MSSNVPSGRTPLLFVFSGPSGVGKDSVIQQLRTQVTDICYPITATTREPRPGEVPGMNYHFLTNTQYEAMLDRGELLAPANVHGYSYGVPVDQVRHAFGAGEDVFLKIDVQGAMHLRRRIPQAVFVFLAPPSMDDLVARLRARHTESPENLERRIRDAHFEMEQLGSYDYAVVNRDGCVNEAAGSVACIISAERLRTHRQPIDLRHD